MYEKTQAFLVIPWYDLGGSEQAYAIELAQKSGEEHGRERAKYPDEQVNFFEAYWLAAYGDIYSSSSIYIREDDKRVVAFTEASVAAYQKQIKEKKSQGLS